LTRKAAIKSSTETCINVSSSAAGPRAAYRRVREAKQVAERALALVRVVARVDKVVELEGGDDELAGEAGVVGDVGVLGEPDVGKDGEEVLGGGEIVGQPEGGEESAEGVLDADAAEAEALDVGLEHVPALARSEVGAELGPVELGRPEEEVGDGRGVVGDAALGDEVADGAPRVVGEAVDKGEELGVLALGDRINVAALVLVPRSGELELLDLDDRLDEEASVERGRDDVARLRILFDEGFGDEEDIVEEEEVAIFDGVSVDDLEDRGMEEQSPGRVVEAIARRRLLDIGGVEDVAELGEDALLRL
jgi:hypothetical protein